jgi:hypothetical protein
MSDASNAIPTSKPAPARGEAAEGSGLGIVLAVTIASLDLYPARQESQLADERVHFPQEVREIGFG